MAENRVIGGAGAAGIPVGRRVGSKGQAEVKVLQRTKPVSFQPLGQDASCLCHQATGAVERGHGAGVGSTSSETASRTLSSASTSCLKVGL